MNELKITLTWCCLLLFCALLLLPEAAFAVLRPCEGRRWTEYTPLPTAPIQCIASCPGRYQWCGPGAPDDWSIIPPSVSGPCVCYGPADAAESSVNRKEALDLFDALSDAVDAENGASYFESYERSE